MPQEPARPSHGLVGRSPQLEQIRKLIDKVGRSLAPVLVLGESGTGKELVARALYNTNPQGRFVPIDCGTLVGPLMESELFGHTRGAFTGAAQAKKGLIETANGGTAFFDEIGDLPLELQVKLLRLLQEREFRPIGALEMKRVETRVIAATKHNLPEGVAAGRFREDLYYRLNVVKITLPPLRERPEDIGVLIDHFLSANGRPLRMTAETRKVMELYEWPGNVRQLRNTIERMVTMSSGPELHIGDLPSVLQYVRDSDRPAPVPAEAADDSDLPVVRRAGAPVLPLHVTERIEIIKALEHTGGDRSTAAKMLGIGRTTLYRKLKEHRISL